MILLCMFLAALNFVNRYYFGVYGAVIFFFLAKNRKLRINMSTLMLFVLALSYLAFDPVSQDAILDMIKPFAYLMCYIVSSSLFYAPKNEKLQLQAEENRVLTVIYILTGGVFLRFILNMITNWDIDSRNVIDFWTKSEMSATAQATLACLAAGVAIAFLFSNAGKVKKAIAIAIIAVIITYNLILAGRTLFVMIAILAIAALLYTRISEKKKISKAVLIVGIIVLLFVWLYNIDAFGMKTVYQSSNFYQRFYGETLYGENQEIDEDSRMQNKMEYLKRFVDHPWGGENIKKDFGHHAHDLYLDTYDEAGIFALVAVVAYIIASLRRMIQCAKSKKLHLVTRTVIFCIYLVCNMQFWIEPIIRGLPWLFAVYCFIDGAVTYLLMQEEDYTEENLGEMNPMVAGALTQEI